MELGLLPIPRRDIERLQQIIGMQHRLLDIHAPHRAQRSLLHRSTFAEAVTWLEIHGDRPDVVDHWRQLQVQAAPSGPHHHTAGGAGDRGPVSAPAAAATPAAQSLQGAGIEIGRV